MDGLMTVQEDIRAIAGALVRLRIRLLTLRDEEGATYALDAMLEASDHMTERLADLFELGFEPA
ncbi:MAG: hypothetical protein QOE90_3467 [Thermoplasmata archaeon]|jgi:hypothetical protein|nr:hypothetical protein [Thermoplasmata archaeon]